MNGRPQLCATPFFFEPLSLETKRYDGIHKFEGGGRIKWHTRENSLHW
jgi:hypothetical protein